MQSEKKIYTTTQSRSLCRELFHVSAQSAVSGYGEKNDETHVNTHGQI